MKQKNYFIELLVGAEYENCVVRDHTGRPLYAGSPEGAIEFLKTSFDDFKDSSSDVK